MKFGAKWSLFSDYITYFLLLALLICALICSETIIMHGFVSCLLARKKTDCTSHACTFYGKNTLSIML